jgi:hypothetical protein
VAVFPSLKPFNILQIREHPVGKDFDSFVYNYGKQHTRHETGEHTIKEIKLDWIFSKKNIIIYQQY